MTTQINAKAIISLALAYAFISDAVAEPVPVLETLPGCDFEQTEVIELNRRQTLHYNQSRDQQFRALRLELIESARQKAPEGIIGLHIIHSDYRQEELSGQTRSDRDRFQARISMQLVGIYGCSPDQEALRQPTAFNRYGDRRLGQLQATLAAGSAMEIRIEQPQRMQLEHHRIEPEKGFYGAALGMTEAELLAIFSAPDTTMLLGDHVRLLGFGRNHWVWLAQGNVQAFSHENPLLSAYGLIQISDSHDIEFTNWTLALDSQEVGAGARADTITPPANAEGLVLEFIINHNRQPAILTGVTLRRSDFPLRQLQLPFTEPAALDSALEVVQNAILQPTTAQALEALNRAFLDVPVSNQVSLSAGRSLSWLAPDLAVTWGANDLRQIEVAPFFNTLNGAPLETPRAEYWLKKMGLPTTIEEWETAVPSAFAMSGELTAFETEFSITVYYDDRADGQPIDSFKIEFH